jgi:exonuclease I
VRASKPTELTPELAARFHDERLRDLFPLFKARNYSRSLSDGERSAWEAHRYHALFDGGEQSRLSKFMHRLTELSAQETAKSKHFLLEELQLYAESIFPSQEI